MEFWRVEVKGGEPVIVTPGNDFMLHLSQAVLELGDSKNVKDKDSAVEVPLFVKVDGKKLVLGTLSPEKIPQLAFEDLVFETEFELSHNWNNGSVYFTGYKSALPDHEEDEYSGKVEKLNSAAASYPEATKLTPAAASYPEATKRKSKPVWADSDDSSSSEDSLSWSPKKKAGLSNMWSDSDDSSDEEEEEGLSPSPKKKAELSNKKDIDSDDSSDEEEEESLSSTPKKKAELSNKRADSESDDSSDDEEESLSPSPKKKAELSSKRDIDSALGSSSVPNKKPKQSTPQRTDGKEGSHPHKEEGKLATMRRKIGPRRRAAHTSAYDLWELIMTPSEGSTLVKTKNGWKLICS